MNRYLFELLKRIEEGARRLASLITNAGNQPLKELLLVETEVSEIENALASFKREVAAGAVVGPIAGRLIKK
jgi:hypothetical protein